MKQYSLNEIRELFLDYFESKGHLKMHSFSLVPTNDNSLLLINSGMAPLKPYFTGEEKPERKRVTTCQKCIRTPDIDNVGKTARHGTFFEMLGNFSFGDYFKKEAILFAWEFLTKILEIDEDVLYVSVYEDDDESKDLWMDLIGLSEDRIFKMGKEDNFWEIGVGPCGPCSEIYVDRGEKYGCGKESCTVGCDCDRYVEIWNLVFTGFDKDEKGNYNKLKNPNIDTGMGLERLSAIMQGADTIFEVDTIKYVLDYICSLANIKYGSDKNKDVSIRVVTDHIRSVVFMLSDGITFSNEGRGYILKRLLRRAIRHGKLLGINGKFMVDVAKKVIDKYKDAYPELEEKQTSILKIIDIEEDKFNETINQGLNLLNNLMENIKEKYLSGEEAFKLYDTYGFPLELTSEILKEKGLDVDIKAFEEAMKKQKEKARNARKISVSFKDEMTDLTKNIPPTEFVGYEEYTKDAKLLAIIFNDKLVDSLKAGDEALLIFDKTPFYATSGGQMNDIGTIKGNNLLAYVKNVSKAGDKFIHATSLKEGTLEINKEYKLLIDTQNRLKTAKNHSATHILHKALKEVLGEHVNQAGSSVDNEKLRFDFTHFEKLTGEEIAKVQMKVNDIISQCLEVSSKVMDIKEAKKEGATALFGEKYGSSVRVVKMGYYSIELCGGCHVKNTGFINAFKIISESSVANGVRRIEAITGIDAIRYLNLRTHELERIEELVSAKKSEAEKKIEELLVTLKASLREIKELNKTDDNDIIKNILNKKEEISSKNIIVARVDNLGVNDIRNICDKIKDKLGSVIIFIASVNEAQNKGVLITSVTKDIVASGFNSSNFIREVASSVGSSGGGRADMAQAGLKDLERADEAVLNAKKLLNKML